MEIVIILILVFGSIVFLLLNDKLKKTIYWANQNLMSNDFDNGVPDNLKVVNLGSTYAKYAFQNYCKLQLQGFNFALQSQSLQYDRLILEKYASHLSKNCVVIAVLAPCTSLFNGKSSLSNQYYSALGIQTNPLFKWKSYVKYEFPLVNIKNLAHIFIDDKKKKSINSLFPPIINDNEIEKNMSCLVDDWKKLFNLRDFKNINFSTENIHTMQKSSDELKKILDVCNKKEFRFLVVVPPFSKVLNQYFSDEFVDATITANVLKVCKSQQILLDYRKNAYFQKQTDLFCDGGFILNQKGSIIFMKMLFKDLKKYGIVINNNTSGKEAE